MIRHYNITVSGKVHGVFYRATAVKMAKLLGVTGFVQNEENGTVYCEAEGEEEMLVKFVQWCQHGPDKAEVTHVSVSDGEVKGFNKFRQNR